MTAEQASTPENDGEALLPPHERAWPLPWMSPFLRSLSRIPSVSAACRVAGIGRTTAYRNQKERPEFAEAWRECDELSKDFVERTAHTWATTGVPVKSKRTRRKSRVNDKGVLEVIEEETIETESAERSATLMIFWLKAHYPAIYRFADKIETTGADGGPIEFVIPKEEADRAIGDFSARVVRLADARSAKEAADGRGA